MGLRYGKVDVSPTSVGSDDVRSPVETTPEDDVSDPSDVSDAAEVRDHPEASRFEVVADGEVAGFAVYRRRPGRIIFVHTEVRPEFGGRGLGGRLAAGALDAARAAGERVVPLCPFIAAYIDSHPEYQDLVDTRMMQLLSDPA
jgi:uncharacterized protein